MKRIKATDMHPMRITPSNFTKGDVVKKIFMDNIQTPFVGVVTSVIPSINKVEVEWPHGMEQHDPWDLIKVNPLINPPTVKEDTAYDSYQNEKAQRYNEDYCDRIRHYSVLDEYLKENLLPVILKAASLYNDGYSKKDAFSKLRKNCENKTIVANALNRVFNDSVSIKRSNILTIDGVAQEADLSIEGNSDIGFKVSYKLGNKSEQNFYGSFKKAVSNFKNYEGILESIDSKDDLHSVVAHVNRLRKQADEEIKDLNLEEK